VDLTLSELRTLPDEALMEHLKRGHDDALALLFDRYYRLVISVAIEILHDRGEAEDLLQDVFFEIYRVIDNFDPSKGSAKTWILQYAYHRSLNRRHYLNLRHFYDRQEISELGMLEPRYSQDTWNGLTFDEWARVIRDSLGTLNEMQRTTLELACFQGLLLSEIADRMNESQSNVRHYYYRGLKKLRDSLRERSCFEERLARSQRGG
jgi:RNA polymerase sigma-70 factor (ECF subfamily)